MKLLHPSPVPSLRADTVARFLLAALGLIAAGTSFAAPSSSLVPLDQILWHPVEGKNHEKIGAVTDVLLDLPSGRIAFVAIEPAALFRRSKAVPADALTLGPDGSLQLGLDEDAWIHAPVVSWDGQTVVQFGQNGYTIKAYRDPWWQTKTPQDARGLAVVAPRPGERPAAFGSVNGLQGEQVHTVDRQAIGTLRGFLFDWRNRSATYAVVTAGAEPGGNGFAIPIALLVPPRGTDTIVVNVPFDALDRAPMLAANRNTNGNPTQVYRYRPATAIASSSRSNPAARGQSTRAPSGAARSNQHP